MNAVKQILQAESKTATADKAALCVWERGKALYSSSVLKALYGRVCTLNALVSKTRKVY